MRLTNSFELQTGTLEELNAIITKPGFKGTIANLPAEMYFKCAGVSRSALLDMEQSYAHFEENRKNPKKPTKDMIFGSAFHDYTMLPADFERHFAVEPVKEDGMLDTAEQLKAHLAKFIDTSKLKEEMSDLEHKLKAHEESNSLPHPAEEEIISLDTNIADIERAIVALNESDFPSKKEFQASQKESKELIKKHKDKQKELKTQIKEFQAKCKEKEAEIKSEIKSVKDKIQNLESKMVGTKAKLIASIREYDKEVKIWDEVYTEFENNCLGKDVISQEEFSRIKVMKNNSLNHPTTKALSQHSVIYEQTFFWHDADTGMLCKARVDVIYITPKLILPGDWKTTDDASPTAFMYTMSGYEYHIQSAFYLDGMNEVLGMSLTSFLFMPVEKKAPHQMSHYVPDEPTVLTGRVKYKKHLKLLASYEPGGENYEGWKGYPVGVHNIAIPVYKMVEA